MFKFVILSSKFCLTHHSSQVHKFSYVWHGVETSPTTRQRIELLRIKVLHSCVLPFLKSIICYTILFFWDTQYFGSTWAILSRIRFSSYSVTFDLYRHGIIQVILWLIIETSRVSLKQTQNKIFVYVNTNYWLVRYKLIGSDITAY